MVQRVEVELINYLNDKKAPETLRFGINGTEYETDLITENADKLRPGHSDYVLTGLHQEPSTNQAAFGAIFPGWRTPNPQPVVLHFPTTLKWVPA